MSSTVGKISGQILQNDLQRDGVDLAFETDLVYLTVEQQFVGIKTTVPTRDLTVNGTTIVPNIIADNRFSTTELDIIGNEIINDNGDIQLSVTGVGQITAPKITTDGLFLNNNQIGSERSNESVDFTVTGSGRLQIRSNATVYGDLHSTGNITFDGNMTFGDSNNDELAFAAEISSNITPNDTLTYSLGSNLKNWGSLYPVQINGTMLDAGTVTIGGSTLNSRQGKIWYVAKNGHYDNFGDHQNSPFPTIEQALANAESGDMIFVYPGTYVELFPLVIPVGVSVKGSDIRQVIIVPDTSSTHEDVFHMNGETTVEDLTIKSFYYDSINDKGYAFRFAPNFKVTSRSPYVRNISVITTGSVTSISDPRGFDTGDAGRGAMIDGSVANSTSNEAAMLFHSSTFITPGADCIIMKNGVRVEWLNSFIYFAETGLIAESTSVGFAGDGKTRLKIYGISAETAAPGDTVSIENVSAAGTFTTATIESITYDAPYTNVIVDGLVTGWETSLAPPDTSNQQTILFSGGESASHLLDVDYSDFGAEVRAIGSANVYGTYATIANGPGTLMYLITHNFGYIGTGKDSSNDPAAVIEANEVQELNGGRIYYTSLDHKGLFKVGDTFKVDGETGAVTFATQSINISGLGNFEFVSGTNRTSIDATRSATGNIQITNNTIVSTTGNIVVTPQNTQLQISSNVTVTDNNNLSLLSNLTIGENSTFGSNGADSVTFNPRLDQSLLPISNKISSLGTNALRWKTIWLNQINLDDIRISSSKIATTLSNSDLDLQSNGTGSIHIENLKFRNGTVTNVSTGTEADRSILFSPNGTGNTSISGTNALVLPTGTIATRVLSESAEVRYNTGYNVPEGFTTSGLKSLYSVYDSDRNTYVSAELTPGTSDNTLRFYAAGVQQVSITSQQVTAARVRVDDIDINNRLIQTFNTNSDLNFDLNGTGNLVIKGFTLRESLLTNNNTDTTTTIQSTGAGYIKFVGPALQIPYGNDAQRSGFPTTVEVGTHRWNTERGYLEVYNGTAWQVATGEGEAVTGEIMAEFTNVWALIMS